MVAGLDEQLKTGEKMRILYVFLMTFVTAVVSVQAFAIELETKLWINGVENAEIEAGQPAVLELQFLLHKEENKVEPLSDIKTVMGKTMHFVAIKNDLSEFAHFHPVYDTTSATFMTPIHLAMRSEDNFDAQKALPTAGGYHLYVETISKEYGLILRGLDYKTSGKATKLPLEIDEVNGQGIYQIYVDENNKKSTAGAKYRANISVRTLAGEGGDLVYIDLTLMQLDDNGQYMEVEKVQPWLGMGGHAIMISQKGETIADKVFAHYHAQRPEEGAQLKFNHFARGGFSEGVYKVWIQVKANDRVLKFPLAFEY